MLTGVETSMRDTVQEKLRRLPAVEKLLNEPSLISLQESVPRSIIVEAARNVLEGLRDAVRMGEPVGTEDLSLESVVDRVHSEASRLTARSLRRAVNATGVVLHTGLGRSVLSEAARDAVAEVAGGHSTLEIDVETGMRGSRSIHYRRILHDLCGAESAFAVNNNAGAVLLALNTIAVGREVIVSRGQLVEIGGSFRMPDIMMRAGARLVEVGTTNRTRISDYERAITDDTALILRVHPSNFRVVGFTEEASLADMVELGREYGIPVMDDIGSGALIDTKQFGLPGEPMVQDSIRAGADIVCFSGDKLLGGPQAGLIVGKQESIDRISSNPLSRALRLDKMTLAALEATLRLYLDPASVVRQIPTLSALARPLADTENAAQDLARRIDSLHVPGLSASVIDGMSQAGGGSLPGEELPSRLVALRSDTLAPNDIAARFRDSAPPVFGRVSDERFLLDLRTVTAAEADEIFAAAERIFRC